MNTQILACPAIQSVINKINSGQIDSLLERLEGTPFGVYVNAHLQNSIVEQVPAKSFISESNLLISLTSGEKEPGAIKVGWFHSGGAICSFCDDENDCRSHSNPQPDSYTNIGHFSVLADAKELTPKPFNADEYGDLLVELSKHGLGVFLCHGHNDRFAFTELPLGCVAVVKNCKTEFCLRDEVVSNTLFVPNVWRMEKGIREVVGGFLSL